MGGYLIQQKHFHYRTLFDREQPDPTQGMPLWQYMRMKFAASSVPDHRVNKISSSYTESITVNTHHALV